MDGELVAGAASGQGAVMTASAPPPLATDLVALADLYGVATEYDDWAGRRVQVAAQTVRAVLVVLGVDADQPAAALAAARRAAWLRLVAPSLVVRAPDPRPGPGQPALTAVGHSVLVRSRFGVRPTLTVRLEAGGDVRVTEHGPPTDSAVVDGVARTAVPYRLPPDLPLGWHRLAVEADGERAVAHLVVAPARVPLPAGLTRAWGWMVQLYSVRSAGSWGLGDYADLAELVRWSGSTEGGQAGVLLCSPLHAPMPTHPVQPSPYYPASRRFRSPLYLRIEQTPEYAVAPSAVRAEVDALRVPADGERLERDPVWAAKRMALELLHASARTPERESALSAYRAREGEGVEDFALACALAERHGVPWTTWPADLRRRDAPGVATARVQLAERVRFYAWLQLLCDEQLAAVQEAARSAGMPVGVVHDLAVGVDAGGADGWALQDDLALGVTVGAPPDSFNQQGQDWRLPPWRPDRLAETGFAAFRDMLRGVLRHAGGVRVDHVMGLSRLWWVPEGRSPTQGTYVRYDLDALLGVLALEARRAEALVVGEDLGTVEPALSAALADNGVLGSAVLWFENDDAGRPVPPTAWPELTMASVTTHDLPTVAGWLSDEHVRVRAELGLLGVPLADEQRRTEAEREALLALARAEGVLGVGNEDDPEAVSIALHALLLRAPSRLVLAALTDAVGDLRQPNLPGTTDAYPNWQLPVAGPDGHALSLEQLRDDERVRRLVRLMHKGVAT